MEPKGLGRDSLLDLLGGEPALNSLIGAFYFGVLADERLAPFFADSDIESLLKHQRAFFAKVLGAEGPVCGSDLAGAHRHLVERQGLDDGHFDAIVEVLSLSMLRLGYTEKYRGEIVRRVLRFRPEVLGRHSDGQ